MTLPNSNAGNGPKDFAPPLTVNYYDDGPGDTTGGRPHPAVLKLMQAEREKIELFNAWAKQRLAELSAQRKQQRAD